MKAQALVFLGPPGAGKGTQASQAAAKFGIPHISTGEMLRQAAAKGSPVGLAAKDKMEAGELVPDDMMCRIVEERISEPDCRKGFVLDGFPRTVGQARFLDELLERPGGRRLLVISLQVKPELLMKRLTGRRVCPVCGAIYNMFLNPPAKDSFCDRDGARLTGRADDKEEAIRQRLAVYERDTAPLIDYYEKRAVLRNVDGGRDPAVIAEELHGLLKDA
jgi:adenylate kinase